MEEKPVAYKTRSAQIGKRKSLLPTNLHLTAIIERDRNMYVSLCPELDIASQGVSIEEAKANLTEAIELFLETASQTEIINRMRGEVFITSLNVRVG